MIMNIGDLLQFPALPGVGLCSKTLFFAETPFSLPFTFVLFCVHFRYLGVTF